jgi:hypothetical protein
MCSMNRTETTPTYYAEDGHPLNVQRGSRYHDERNGITVCGHCAVANAMDVQPAWHTDHSLRLLANAGYEPDPYVTGDEHDWCVQCDADFDRNGTYPRT